VEAYACGHGIASRIVRIIGEKFFYNFNLYFKLRQSLESFLRALG
jgi:hypothetical protein